MKFSILLLVLLFVGCEQNIQLPDKPEKMVKKMVNGDQSVYVLPNGESITLIIKGNAVDFLYLGENAYFNFELDKGKIRTGGELREGGKTVKEVLDLDGDFIPDLSIENGKKLNYISKTDLLPILVSRVFRGDPHGEIFGHWATDLM